MGDRIYDDFLNKEMTRKQFLKYASGMIVGVFGISNFIASLVNFSNNQSAATTLPTSSDDANFGSRRFGK